MARGSSQRKKQSASDKQKAKEADGWPPQEHGHPHRGAGSREQRQSIGAGCATRHGARYRRAVKSTLQDIGTSYRHSSKFKANSSR